MEDCTWSFAVCDHLGKTLQHTAQCSVLIHQIGPVPAADRLFGGLISKILRG